MKGRKNIYMLVYYKKVSTIEPSKCDGCFRRANNKQNEIASLWSFGHHKSGSLQNTFKKR